MLEPAGAILLKVNPISIILAFGQAIGFKLQDLSDRRLQEAGASPFGTFALQRYALFPAVIWSLAFIRMSDLQLLLNNSVLVAYLIAIAVLWNIQSFLGSYVMNTINSMSGLASLQYLLYLPLLLLVGIYFNHDVPNLYSIAAILLLLLAFALQPSQHVENTRARFALPLVVIVGLIILRSVLDAVNAGLTRASLSMVSPEFFLGLFAVLTMSLCWLWTLFIPRRTSDVKVLREKRILALSIPLLWFAASIPETFVYAALPIYTVVSIGAVVFAFDAISDFFHKRIRMTLQTAVFILLVLAGSALAVVSI